VIAIGIGHKSRQGKDAFSDFLVSYLRMNTKSKKIVKLGWADALKNICHQTYSWTGIKPPQHYEVKPEDRNIKYDFGFMKGTVVDLWIAVGNHFREMDQQIWVNASLKCTQADVVIFKDTRYLNEAEALKASGGILVKVVRPGFEGLPSVTDNALNGFEGWDITIQNNGDLQQLHALAENFARKYVFPKLS
jgi:hypothetical protein